MRNIVVGKGLVMVASTLLGAGIVSWAVARNATDAKAEKAASGIACLMGGQLNSLGAVVSEEGKLYRCSAVLKERGVADTAWVQVRMSSTIVE